MQLVFHGPDCDPHFGPLSNLLSLFIILLIISNNCLTSSNKQNTKDYSCFIDYFVKVGAHLDVILKHSSSLSSCSERTDHTQK